MQLYLSLYFNIIFLILYSKYKLIIIYIIILNMRFKYLDLEFLLSSFFIT